MVWKRKKLRLRLEPLRIIRFPGFNNFALICRYSYYNYDHIIEFISMHSNKKTFKFRKLFFDWNKMSYLWQDPNGNPIPDFPYFVIEPKEEPIITFLERYPQNISDEHDFFNFIDFLQQSPRPKGYDYDFSQHLNDL